MNACVGAENKYSFSLNDYRVKLQGLLLTSVASFLTFYSVELSQGKTAQKLTDTFLDPIRENNRRSDLHN